MFTPNQAPSSSDFVAADGVIRQDLIKIIGGASKVVQLPAATSASESRGRKVTADSTAALLSSQEFEV